MITTVIFDIGNVLAAYDWEDALKRLGYSEETREIIGNAVFRSADWNEMDRGVLTLEELLQRFIKRASEYEKEIRQAIYNYKDMAHQYDYTKPWLKELKEKGLRLYYLSNYGEFASSLRVMKTPVRSLKACWPGKGKAPSPSRSE